MQDKDGFSKIITGLIDNYLNANFTPGVAVAAYSAAHPDLALTLARGLANKESGMKASPDVIFELGSVTKVFTATLLALHQPAILDDPLSQHLPVAVGNPQLRNVKLHMLATHTSGFPRETPPNSGPGKDGGMYLFHDQSPPANSALVNFWGNWQPDEKGNYCAPCKIGTCWQYSNVGFVTLGYAAAGTEYNTQLTSQITKPLDMRFTAAQPPKDAKVAQGYVDKKGTVEPAKGEAEDLKSNAHDMLIWLKAQLGEGKVPPTLASAIAMTQKTYFTAQQQCSQAHKPIKFDMGLAWQKHNLKNTNLLMFTKDGDSGAGGQSCWVGYIPEKKAGVAVLTNGDGASQPPAFLGTQILASILGLSASLYHAIAPDEEDV
jgi:beta-lactamase class C